MIRWANDQTDVLAQQIRAEVSDIVIEPDGSMRVVPKEKYLKFIEALMRDSIYLNTSDFDDAATIATLIARVAIQRIYFFKANQ